MKDFFTVLTTLCFCSNTLSISVPASTSLDNTTKLPDGVDTKISLDAQPPGINFVTEFTDSVSIDNLQTNFLIVRVVGALAQRDLQSNVEDGLQFQEATCPDVTILIHVEQGKALSVNFVLWGLLRTHEKLALERGNSYAWAVTAILQGGETLGSVLVIKQTASARSGLPASYNATGDDSLTTRSPAISRRIEASSFDGQPPNLTITTWLTPVEDGGGETSRNMTAEGDSSRAGAPSADENLRTTLAYISTFDLGPNNLYVAYSNTILSLLDLFDPDRPVQLDSRLVHIRAIIAPPSPRRRSAPFNTQARSIRAIVVTAFYTRSHSKTYEIKGTVYVGPTQIMALTFERMP